MTKKHNISIISGSIQLAIGILTLILQDKLIIHFGFKSYFLLFFSALLILAGIGSFLFVYLEGGFTTESLDSNDLQIYLLRQFDKLRSELTKKIEEKNTFEVDENKVQEIITSKIDKITTESLLEQIKSRYEDRLVEDIKLHALTLEIEKIKFRIETETSRAARNGNLNLLIGIFTTFMAIFFLGYSLLNIPQPTESTSTFIYRFIPRLSLSIFIELFSFFFLRIYKKNLDDIKHLNNEMTNIDLKMLALRTALLHKDTESINIVISDLSKTERNFILKKGESTVEIEKNKLETHSSDKILESLMMILNKK